MNIKTDIMQHIHNNGIAVMDSNLFGSYNPDVLTSDLVICVLDTGGPEPDKQIPTKRTTFQVYIRSKNYETGKNAINAIYALFHRKTGQLVVNGTFFYSINALSPGGSIGKNDNGRHEFSINFMTWERE